MKRLILFLAVIISKISIAQITNVNVSLNVLPPYSPYISDYVNYQNKTLITLIPNGLPSDVKEVYFKASVVGDNGISVYTKPNYKPAQGIQIQGSMPKALNSIALQNSFVENNVTVTGINVRELTIGNGLPEGNYVICVQVFDFVTDLPLSGSSPSGCSAQIIIQHVDPPLPLSPSCGTEILATDVQNILFNWTYNPGFTPNFQYLLKIVPVLSTQNPNDAINTMVTPAFFEKIIKSTSYLYGPVDPKLIVGQKYAYRIKVFDPANKTVFKNNGESEVCTFTYVGHNPLFLETTKITSPAANTSFTAALNSSGGVNSRHIQINWTTIDSPGNKITYNLKVVKLFDAKTAEKDMNNNLNVVFNRDLNRTDYDIISEPMSKTIVTKPGNSSGSVNLEDGKFYAIQVTAKGTDTYGKPIVFSDFGKSQIVVFKYVEAKKKDDLNEQNSLTATITGKLVYRYKEENEQPVNTSFVFPPPFKTIKVGPTSQLVPNDESVPDFICNNMFNTTSNVRPLANTPINLVYDYITCKKKDPTQYSDLQSKDVENTPFQQYGSNSTSPNEKAGVVVGTGTTDMNGNFSITFVTNMKFGLLGEYDNTSTYIANYGALRIAVAEPEEKFCNSDVIIFPKKGKTINLPQEVVFPDSYNLEVTVRSDKTIQDQAMGKGNVVPNYPIQLSVIKDDYSKKASYPKEANIEAFKNMNAEILGKKAGVLDFGKTDAQGKYLIKNLLKSYLYGRLTSDDKYIQALEKALEGNFVYQTETKLLFENAGHLENVFVDAEYKLRKRNSVLKVNTTKIELELKPKNPEIYLRAITRQNGNVTQGIANATVTVYEYATKESFFPQNVIPYSTDNNGYIHLKDLAIIPQKEDGVEKVIGPFRSIKIEKDGYVTKWVTSKQKLMYGERFPAQVEQVLEGGGNIMGWVVNEKGEPVVSNIRVLGGPFIKTSNGGSFGIQNCASGMAVLVEVVPCVDNYFSESIFATISSGKLTVINNNGASGFSGKIIVKEKLHRVQFKIVDENNNPVKQSCTSVGLDLSTCYPSGSSNGLTNPISISSPDNEFHVRVVADGYVTYDDYKIIPLAKTPTIIPIKLIKGQTISGTVYDEKTKQPIANARVYSISGVNDDGEIQNETYTDKNGKYKLSGAINKGVYMELYDAYLQLPVDVYAVKTGDNGYLRQKQSVQGLNGSGNADFNLTPLNMKSEIWGIPVEINTVDMNADMSLKISGAFVKIPENTTFKTSSSNAKLPFKNIDVWTLKKPSLTKKAGKFDTPEYYFQPKNDEILLQTNAFKIIAFNKFSCEVLGSDQFYQYPLLKITKGSNGNGVLKGFVTSELASFNFSYNYNGKFLFQEEKPKTNIATNVITYFKNEPVEVLGAEQALTPKAKYALNALYGVSNFKVHNFNASMRSGVVNADKFSISTDIKLNIPLVGINTLPAGTVNVNQNSITWNDHVGEISIPLEKWKITGTGLKYELNKGGFKILDGSLQSSLPTVSLPEILIMPTTIDLGNNTLSGNEKLSLGNVAPLNLYTGSKFNLSYDEAAPFDQRPHYRINIANTGNKSVAYIGNIPGLKNYDKIDIEMLSDYSDGEHKSVLVNPVKHKYFNVISQTVSGIEVGKDYFTLIGNTDLGIPGANNNVTGRFKYNKQSGGIKLTVEKLQTDIEMPGKVKFNGDTFALSENNFMAKGKVLMYKNSPSDGVAVRGVITKTPQQTKMDILPKEEIKMGKEGTRSMEIVKGGNTVTTNTWTLVHFTAKPKGFKTGEKEILEENKDQIDFIVNGAISGDPLSDKKIKIDGIETPFGDLEITFDFDKKILQGALTLVSANITLGPVTIIDGKVNMQIDSKGFILSGAISNAAITPVPIFEGFKSGVALGFYSGTLPDYMKQDLLNVTLYNQLPDLDEGLKGFYVNVMKSLSKADLPQLPGPSLDDIPGMSSFTPTFDFSAGVDLRTSLNVADGTAIFMGGKAEANASCLYNFAVCKIGLAGNAEGEVKLQYAKNEKGEPIVTGEMLFGIGADLIYCVGSKGLRIGLIMGKTGNGFEFTPTFKQK